MKGSIKNDLRGILVCIYNTISKQGYEDIELDFSEVTYADLITMLPICNYCCYYRANGIDFKLILPDSPILARLFVNTNWANLIEPLSYQGNLTKRSNNLPALQFQDSDAQYNVVNRAMDILMQTISVQDRRQLKALEWALSEITDNVLNHSESVIGGILQIQCFPARNVVTFAVVDAGLGIPATLRRVDTSLTSDSDALDRAIREGVTRNSVTNQGNGLYGTFKCCEESNGSFVIKSGNAALSFERGRFSVTHDTVPFKGSFVSATINYTAPNLLERALVFRGKVHVPANDYIEIHFNHVGEKTLFELLKEVDGFGNREHGRRAKLKIDNILVDKSCEVIIDFEGIPIVSSSFADELFGRLFLELGPMDFGRRCEFRNIDPTVQRLIDRAILQRMKAG